MLPFAQLALAAELLPDWNAALALTQAGIMICGNVAGAFLFSFLWTLLSAAAQAAARDGRPLRVAHG